MKIALVSEHADPLAVLGGVDAGGQNVHVAALAGGLAARGHDVVVYTRRERPDAETMVRADGYTVRRITAGPPTEVPKDALLPHMAEFGDRLAARFAADRPDVVHAHFWMSGLAGLRAVDRVGGRIPVAQTFHALGAVKRREQGARDTSPEERIPTEQRLARRVDRVVATCRDEVRELTALGAPADRVDVVPCGVDTDLFAPQPRPDGPPTLLALGRLVERKGLADVVRALPRLPRARLVVAGGPSADAVELDPEVERLRRLAEHLAVGDRVCFLGGVEREHVPGLVAACDVVVTAPWYEPFGIVPLEAMACGRPVVGTAVGGLLDTVAPGVTGDLVPPRRPDLLAAALGALLADDDRRAAYGAAGRRRVLERFSWPRVVERTEEVYADLVAAAEPAGRAGRAGRADRRVVR